MHLFIVAGSAIALVAWLAILSVVLTIHSARCPACSRRTLRLASAVPFGFRFYRCALCEARCKRWLASWRWYDASGVRDRRRYRGRKAGAWKWVTSADLSETTCGRLLGRKRSWKLSSLIHRTGRTARSIRTGPLLKEKLYSEPETTVGHLLRKKLFRRPRPDEEPPPGPWLDDF